MRKAITNKKIKNVSINDVRNWSLLHLSKCKRMSPSDRLITYKGKVFQVQWDTDFVLIILGLKNKEIKMFSSPCYLLTFLFKTLIVRQEKFISLHIEFTNDQLMDMHSLFLRVYDCFVDR